MFVVKILPLKLKPFPSTMLKAAKSRAVRRGKKGTLWWWWPFVVSRASGCVAVFSCARDPLLLGLLPSPPHVNDIRVHLRNEVTPYRTNGPSPMMMAMTRDWSAE